MAFLFHGLKSNEEKGTMTLKPTLFAAASALVLSVGAATALPAITETPLNLRAGPGIRFPIIGTVPPRARVDVRGCTAGWCRVRFHGESGFARRGQLAIAGRGPAVAVVPGYAYDTGPYYDDYYDYGYEYGPSVGFAFGGGDRFHHRGNRSWDRGRVGTWSGGSHWNGGTGWSGNRVGAIQGGGGRQGFAGPPASWQRPGTGIGATGAGRSGMAGASVGMRSGGGAVGAGAVGGGAVGGGGHAGGGAQGGFAGSIAKH